MQLQTLPESQANPLPDSLRPSKTRLLTAARSGNSRGIVRTRDAVFSGGFTLSHICNPKQINGLGFSLPLWKINQKRLLTTSSQSPYSTHMNNKNYDEDNLPSGCAIADCQPGIYGNICVTEPDYKTKSYGFFTDSGQDIFNPDFWIENGINI